MTFNRTIRALVMFAVPYCACAQAHRHSTRIEPSYSFALLDKKLTLLDQQQTSVAADDTKFRIAAVRSIKRTAASIQRTAFRLQRLYERRHERFGAQTFRVVRLRATAVQRAANSLEFARNTRARGAELKVLNTRILALIEIYRQFTGFSLLLEIFVRGDCFRLVRRTTARHSMCYTRRPQRSYPKKRIGRPSVGPYNPKHDE
jgi:hypothetical protein